MQSLFFTCLALFVSIAANAQVEHNLVRRITVFPVKAGQEFTSVAEESWWQIREALTDNQRFLVASRNFLIQRDVFQPRSELKPADVVILAKLLDTNAIVTTFLEDRTLSMRVYEGEYGRILWSHDYQLQASLPISEQLVDASKKMIYDFIASIPYEGFVKIDPMSKSAILKQGTKSFVKVFAGKGTNVVVGDSAQFIRLYHDSIKPLFGPDTAPEIFAEGIVASTIEDGFFIEITRMVPGAQIKEMTLVRFPTEMKRLRDTYLINRDAKARIDTEFYAPEMTPTKAKIAENKPLVASLAFIANLATFLLLAF